MSQMFLLCRCDYSKRERVFGVALCRRGDLQKFVRPVAIGRIDPSAHGACRK